MAPAITLEFWSRTSALSCTVAPKAASSAVAGLTVTEVGRGGSGTGSGTGAVVLSPPQPHAKVTPASIAHTRFMVRCRLIDFLSRGEEEYRSYHRTGLFRYPLCRGGEPVQAAFRPSPLATAGNPLQGTGDGRRGGSVAGPSPPPRSSRARSCGAPVSPREPSPAAQRGRTRRGPTTPRRVRFRPPSRHLRRTLRCLSQPTQCQTLRSGQGDAAPPLNPQLPAPLPGQRAVGAAVANRVAGALPADHLTVMAAAHTPPTRSRRPTMARRRTWTAPALAIERERSRLARLHRARPDTARTMGEHAPRSGARASFGIEGAEPLASPFVGTKGMLA